MIVPTPEPFEVPLGPVDRGLNRIREIQDALDAGVSYKTLTKRYGLNKAELKSLQRINTGRFYFKPGIHPSRSQTLLAERFDPVTNAITGPGDVTRFYHAADAWTHLSILRARLNPKPVVGFANGPTIDFTPTL
jgi:hypothetical protein